MLHHRLPLVLMSVCLCSLALLCASCRAKETEPPIETVEPSPEVEVELPFATIERCDIFPHFRYTGRDPKVTTTDSAEEIGLMEGEVTLELVEELQQLDYDSYIALVVFQGLQPEILSPPAVEITKVTRSSDTLRVYAYFHRRIPDTLTVGKPIVNSPYPAIQIPRQEVPAGGVKVLVVVDNKVVAQDTIVLPEED